MSSSPRNPRWRRLLEGIALLLIAASAILLQRSATAPWADARAADGRHLQVSPIGLVDFGLGTSGTAARACRWWPKLGDEELCAVADNGEPYMARLRRAYPLVVVAMWISVLALFLNALRIPHVPPAIGIVITMVVPVFGIAALWSVSSSTNAALAVLTGADVRVALTAFGSVFAAALCMVIAGGLLVASRIAAPRLRVIPMFVFMSAVAAWPSAAAAQDAPSSTCWRFAFGPWTPPLDWERAGHTGKAGDLANRVQRIRDSVFAKDTNAVRNKAMMWERTKTGWSVVLFPDWWPVGVKVAFDSVLAGGREMTGQATAFVADAGQEPSRARASAMRCPG